jgi:hypothetical protein
VFGMTAKMTKVALTDIPDEPVQALRALADFIEAHPDIKPESIELNVYNHAAYLGFVKRYAVERESGGNCRWATLTPRDSGERAVQVEIIVFGDR